MFCHNCGAKGVETAAFCGKCGTKFRKVKDNVVKTDIQNIPPKSDKVRKDDIRSERIKEQDRQPPKPDKVRTDDIRSGVWKDRHGKTSQRVETNEEKSHKEQFWSSMDEAASEEEYEKSKKYDDEESKRKMTNLAVVVILAGVLILGIGVMSMDRFNDAPEQVDIQCNDGQVLDVDVCIDKKTCSSGYKLVNGKCEIKQLVEIRGCSPDRYRIELNKTHDACVPKEESRASVIRQREEERQKLFNEKLLEAEEEIERLTQKINSIQEEHDMLKKMTIEEIWISECDELLKALD